VLADLEALVRSALDDGAVTLAEVTTHVLSNLPENMHYAATGRVADAVARVRTVRVDRERPWAAVRESLEIEDWAVLGRGRVS
jgi:chromosome partition protein MukF